jgi:hypothetical protein
MIELVGHFVDNLCVANISINQATSAGMSDFVNRVIRSGFALGRRSSTEEPEEHDLFPRLSRSNLRDRIVERDSFCLLHDIDEFKGNFLRFY